MREILFRGKRIDNDAWVYGSFCMDALEQKNGLCGIDGFIRLYDFESRKTQTYEVDRETVGQYTGLTDKNGRKVFEGDIVEVNYDAASFCKRGEVFFTGSSFMIKEVSNVFTLYGLILWCEVIGNIHDNPELLGVNDNA